MESEHIFVPHILSYLFVLKDPDSLNSLVNFTTHQIKIQLPIDCFQIHLQVA